MINSVSIKVIPHKEQRYETVGDWEIDGDSLTINVSDTGNWLYNMAIAVHELIEVILCVHKGITQKEVDEFDIEYEKNRPEGNVEEPGDDPKAPYHIQHGYASSAERMLIAALDENWKVYNETIEKM